MEALNRKSFKHEFVELLDEKQIKAKIMAQKQQQLRFDHHMAIV